MKVNLLYGKAGLEVNIPSSGNVTIIENLKKTQDNQLDFFDGMQDGKK